MDLPTCTLCFADATEVDAVWQTHGCANLRCPTRPTHAAEVYERNLRIGRGETEPLAHVECSSCGSWHHELCSDAPAVGVEVREEWGVRESGEVSGFEADEQWARTYAGMKCDAPDHDHAHRTLVHRTVTTTPWEVQP